MQRLMGLLLLLPSIGWAFGYHPTETEERHLSLGLTAGYVGSSARAYKISGTTQATQFFNGFGGGLILNGRLMEYVWASPQVLVLRKGVRNKTLSQDVAATFIDFPLPIKFQIDVEKNLDVSLQSGPRLGAKLKGAAFKGFNLSIDLGAGIEWHVKDPVSLCLDFKYEIGLLNVARATGDSMKLWGVHFFLGANYYFF